MILSSPTLKDYWKKGKIKFEPNISEEQISFSSIDLRLGTTFLQLEEELAAEVAAGGDVAWRVQDTKWADFSAKYCRIAPTLPNGDFRLEPKHLILAFTEEYLFLDPSLAGRVEGKSGIARRGLVVHMTAPTINAGFVGSIQLEMYNFGPAAILLSPHKPICQLVIEKVTKPVTYTGQFTGQKQSLPTKGTPARKS